MVCAAAGADYIADGTGIDVSTTYSMSADLAKTMSGYVEKANRMLRTNMKLATRLLCSDLKDIGRVLESGADMVISPSAVNVAQGEMYKKNISASPLISRLFGNTNIIRGRYNVINFPILRTLRNAFRDRSPKNDDCFLSPFLTQRSDRRYVFIGISSDEYPWAQQATLVITEHTGCAGDPTYSLYEVVQSGNAAFDLSDPHSQKAVDMLAFIRNWAEKEGVRIDAKILK